MSDGNVRTISHHIERTYGGKKLPPRYDWKRDPKGYSNGGHIPPNRCYHCGSRFVGSSVAAFCCVCDMAMTIGGIEPRVKQLIENRIRIPDDVKDEEAYRQKMNIPQVDIKPGIFRVDQLINDE